MSDNPESNIIYTGTKQSLDAAVWGVAIASPGLIGSLGQADKLASATRFPEYFGYVFGAMELAFLMSIVFAVVLYHRLNLILGLVDATRGDRKLVRQNLDEANRQLESENPDFDKTREATGKAKSLSTRWGRSAELTATLENQRWRLIMPRIQRRLILVGYLLFVVIVLTSDFFKLAAR